MHARHIIIFALLGWASAACRSPTPIERASVGGGQRQSGDLSEEKDDKEDLCRQVPGDEPATDKIDYPLLSFRGAGYTTYKMNDRLSMAMSLETKLDDKSLTVESVSAKVECGNKAGCNQDEVDRSVKATTIGKNVYQRALAPELQALRAKGFNAAAYGIFVKKVKGQNGIEFTFDKPLPVYPWPAVKSRYQPLAKGPASWTATATASKFIPTRPGLALKDIQGDSHVAAGNAKKELNVSVTVSLEDVGQNKVKLTFELTIEDDKERILYKYFPVPRSSTFVIDTKNKDVRAVQMTSWLNGDKSKKEEESVLDFKLCSKSSNSGTKSFSCE